MEILERRQEQRARTIGQLSDGSDHQTVVETVHTVRVRLRNGGEAPLEFDHDPSDDELQARIPAAIATVRPTNLADRVETAAALAEAWNALRLAAAEAAGDPAFTAAERTRLAAARDLARAALRGYV